MARARRVVREFWQPVCIALLGVVILVNYVLLLPLLSEVSGQSLSGETARARQVAVYPVSVQLYEDAYDRGVITYGELQCFKSSALCEPHPARIPTPTP